MLPPLFLRTHNLTADPPPGPSSSSIDSKRSPDTPTGAPLAFLQPNLRVSFSLLDELNVRIHWRNMQRRLLAVTGEAPTDELERRLALVDRAVEEFFLYRKWLLACAAPPLAFSGRVDRDQLIAARVKWVAREVDSVIAGEPLAPPDGFEQARNEVRVKEYYQSQFQQAMRWKGELMAEEAQMRRLDGAFATTNVGTDSATPVGRNERLFWLPLLRCDAFGADAPKNGYNRRYQAWLGQTLMLTDEDDKAAVAAVAAVEDDDGSGPSKKRAAPRAATAEASARASRSQYRPPDSYGLGWKCV